MGNTSASITCRVNLQMMTYPKYGIHSTRYARSGTPKTYCVRFGEPLAAQDDIWEMKYAVPSFIQTNIPKQNIFRTPSIKAYMKSQHVLHLTTPTSLCFAPKVHKVLFALYDKVIDYNNTNI